MQRPRQTAGSVEDRMPPQQRQQGLMLAVTHLLDQAASLEGGPRLRDRISRLQEQAATLAADFDSLRNGPVCANCDEAIEWKRLVPYQEREGWVHTTGDAGREFCFPAIVDSPVAEPKEGS